MNTRRKSAIFTFATLAILVVGGFASCNQKPDRDAEIESMEARLNAIIDEHQQMKEEYENYADVLSEKDSAINAQANEIRSLIEQLRVAKSGKTVYKTVVKDNAAELTRQAEEARQAESLLQAKQQQIADLEARLQQQQADAAALRQQAAAGTTASQADRRQLDRLLRQVSDQDALIAKLTNDVVRLTNDNDSLVSQNAYMAKHQSGVNESAYIEQIASLQQQVSGQQVEIERLKGELSQQQAAVADAREAIEAAKAESRAKISVNKKIQELQQLCESYAREIEQLRAENAQLRTENEALRGQVDNMRQEAEQNAMENAKLAVKLNRASILVTKDLVVTPLKVNSNGIGKETNRASSTTSLMFDGTILDNNVVEPGTIQLYARVVGSNGRVLEAVTADNAAPLFEANGSQMLFTMTQPVEFTGESRTFHMVWNRGEKELAPGIYKATLYANGNAIGSTIFRLK